MWIAVVIGFVIVFDVGFIVGCWWVSGDRITDRSV